MKEQYTICVEAKFEAAHHLRQYHGKPEEPHNHSWKVEAKFLCRQLNDEGIGIDYVEAEKALRGIAALLDHSDINKLPPFDKINPTSEHIAKWFFQKLKEKKISRLAKLDEMVLWEGPSASVSYREK